MELQDSAYTDAKKLAKQGEEYSHLIQFMSPDQAMMFKNFVLDLPEDLACKTIYGKVTWSQRENVPRGRGRPRKN